uniref:Uncharacterized protein n=1 Tax=Bacillus cereus HuA4-10 TaxID=1053206 RepID=J8CSH8_BACCE|nr:hypothetical protein IGC_04572 [Bacillus cereus HuA4-10]
MMGSPGFRGIFFILDARVSSGGPVVGLVGGLPH